jgi:hypothetical protein
MLEFLGSSVLISIFFASSIWVVLSFVKVFTEYIKVDVPEKYLCLKCITFWFTLIVLLWSNVAHMAVPIAALAALINYFVDLNSLTKL